MGTNDQPDCLHEPADAVEHLLALKGVGLDDLPLVGVEPAGFVDDPVGDGDLADVVQERPEFEVATLLGFESELVAKGERELHHAPRMLTGVAVVGLDDIAQHQGGAAVGGVELDQTLDPLVALAGEDGQQRQQREGGEDHRRSLVDVFRNHERHAREPGVNRVDPGLAQLSGERCGPFEPIAHRGGREVNGELSRQRADEQKRAGVARSNPGQREQSCRSDREP